MFGMLLNGCGKDIDTNMSEQMEDFSFITKDKETLNLDDLKGEWWITYMSYIDCRAVCPRTNANIVNVQRLLKEDDLQPQIISFSVDSENDEPEDILEYEVDLDSWDFLTGYDFETIQEMSENSLKYVLESGAAGQMFHCYIFYLVSPNGEVVKKYAGMSTNELDILVENLKKVFYKT